MIYLLLILIPVALVAYLVWDHKRKSAAREAASAGRLQELLGAVHEARTDQREGTSGEPDGVPAVEAAQPSATYVRRERVLDPARTLLYYLLRTVLPDHVVFAQVPLSAVLEPSHVLPVHAREESLRRVASRVVDFVVSDRNMQPVAVIQLLAAADASAADAPSPESSLARAGVRYIELDAGALPKKDVLRGIVLGEKDAAVRAQSDAAPHTS